LNTSVVVAARGINHSIFSYGNMSSGISENLGFLKTASLASAFNLAAGEWNRALSFES
jgi:hypothetical protein